MTAYVDPVTKDMKPFFIACIIMVFSFVLSFLLTYFIYNDKNGQNEDINTKKDNETKDIIGNITVKSPLKGKFVNLTDVEDEEFSNGALGKGIAVMPTEGKVISPVDGVVTTLFPTFHAIGLTSDDDLEVLIHIGLDTVKLNGQHFNSHIKEGQKIKQGTYF